MTRVRLYNVIAYLDSCLHSVISKCVISLSSLLQSLASSSCILLCPTGCDMDVSKESV